MTPNAADLTYTLLPGRPWAAPAHVALYDRAFAFWEQFWSKTLEDIGLDRRKLATDEFWRQDLMSLVEMQGEIVGMHLYTFFPLQALATRRLGYCTRYYNDEYFAALTARGVTTMMSMEFFSVHPACRTKTLGLSLGSVIGRLSCLVGLAHGVDVMIGSARADVPAAAIGYDLGAIPLVKGFEVNGCPTDLIAFFPDKLTAPSDRKAADLADKLWRTRTDLRARPTESLPALKSVA